MNSNQQSSEPVKKGNDSEGLVMPSPLATGEGPALSREQLLEKISALDKERRTVSRRLDKLHNTHEMVREELNRQVARVTELEAEKEALERALSESRSNENQLGRQIATERRNHEQSAQQKEKRLLKIEQLLETSLTFCEELYARVSNKSVEQLYKKQNLKNATTEKKLSILLEQLPRYLNDLREKLKSLQSQVSTLQSSVAEYAKKISEAVAEKKVSQTEKPVQAEKRSILVQATMSQYSADQIADLFSSLESDSAKSEFFDKIRCSRLGSFIVTSWLKTLSTEIDKGYSALPMDFEDIPDSLSKLEALKSKVIEEVVNMVTSSQSLSFVLSMQPLDAEPVVEKLNDSLFKELLLKSLLNDGATHAFLSPRYLHMQSSLSLSVRTALVESIQDMFLKAQVTFGAVALSIFMCGSSKKLREVGSAEKGAAYIDGNITEDAMKDLVVINSLSDEIREELLAYVEGNISTFVEHFSYDPSPLICFLRQYQ